MLPYCYQLAYICMQVSLGLDNPRRIAYHAGQQVFGVACTRTTPARIGDLEETKGVIKLFDARSFERTSQLKCSSGSNEMDVLNRDSRAA